MFTAINLEDNSQKKLEGLIPELLSTWEVQCHHVTLHMGEPFTEEEQLMSKDICVTIDAIAQDNKVCAVRVKEMTTEDGKTVTSHNKTPHVTLCVNRSGGGKPKHSNELRGWEAIPELKLSGRISGNG